MSLKAFHIIFVIVSTMLAVGVGIWAIREYQVTGEAGALAFGAASLAGAVSLVVYGRWFLRKLRGVSML